MAALSLRLTDDIDERLAREAQAEQTSRSEVARTAILDYLDRRECERFMADMVEEMRQAYSDPQVRREALDLAEDKVDEGLDSILAEERAAGIDPAEQWWR